MTSLPTPRGRGTTPTSIAVGALVGALTVALLVVLWSLAATLVAGLTTTLPVGQALLVGLALGAAVGALRTGADTAPWLAVGIGLAAGLAWLAATDLRPLGFDAVRPLWGVGFGLLVFALAGHLVRYALRGIDFRRLRRDLLESIAVRLLRGFAFAFFGMIILFPFWYMLSASLKGRADMLRDPANLAIEWGQGASDLLVGYREVLFTFDFLNFIGNSFLVAFVTMTVTLVMAVLGAYAITRLAFPGRTFLARSILLIYMFPAIVLVIPLYAVFTQLGLRDTLPGLLVVYPATTIPVALYMLRSYFQTLPKDLEEAGLIDGCTRAQVIWRITLPLAMPAIASVGLYVFMIAWNEFLFAFMFLDDPGIFTLPRGMVMLDSQEVPRQYLMAGAMIITVPIMILFFWFEKYLVGGLTAGGVKG
ncbi:MAG: carbohydrate ABC transporter permease [Trueperaceae bacterium]